LNDIQVHIGGGGSTHPTDGIGETAAGAEEAQSPDSDISGGSGDSSAEEAKPQLAPVVLSSGVITHGKTIVIKCIDCQAERTIKPQDVFQVKRCPTCQKVSRNKARAQYRKEKRQREKEQQDTDKQTPAE
jgi:hypothetical protein